MARIRFEYQCEHTGERQAPARQRDYIVRRASTEDCWDCQRATENMVSAKTAAEAGLPPLVGVSDPQRAFGETCRIKALDQFDLTIAGGRVGPVTFVPTTDPEDLAKAKRVREYLATVTDAGWWCDTSHMEVETMLERFLQAAGET